MITPIYGTGGGINTPAIIADATAIAANPARIGWSIQNLGQNALYVRLGSGATSSVFHFALKAGAANDDGTAGTGGTDEQKATDIEGIQWFFEKKNSFCFLLSNSYFYQLHQIIIP